MPVETTSKHQKPTMKKSRVISLLVSAALLGVCGCASDQSQKTDSTAQPPPQKQVEKPKDKRPIDQRLTIGMTKDDVIQACGNPKGRTVSSDGEEIWSFNDAEKAFIPNYTLFGGKINFTTVTFDKDGKVKSWSTSSQGRY
jgi:major membrane immunogen (membrane-anchored lipoprotein)